MAASLLAAIWRDLSAPATPALAFVICDGRRPPPQLLILATYHHPGINRNIFCNYRNAALVVPGAVDSFNVCQTINLLAEASAVPYSKTQKSAIDFHGAVYSAFYLLLLGETGEVIDLHKGSILSLGEKRRRQ